MCVCVHARARVRLYVCACARACVCVRSPQLSVTRGLYFNFSFTEPNSTVFSSRVDLKLVHFRALHPDSMPILVNGTVAPVTKIFHTIFGNQSSLPY